MVRPGAVALLAVASICAGCARAGDSVAGTAAGPAARSASDVQAPDGSTGGGDGGGAAGASGATPSIDTAAAPSADASTDTSSEGSTTAPARYLAAHAAVPEITARLEPFDAAAPVTVLANPNPQGAPLVFAVIAQQDGWVQVQLPVRPNGSSGWIRAADLTLYAHSFRIVVRLAEHELQVFDGDDLVQVEPVGIGRQPTPTPGGSYYLYELLRPPDPTGPYGPYAFGLSGFSDVLTSFAGGDGRLGLHGTDDPASIGQDSSSGCIRLDNGAIERLAQTVPLGTPVTILA